LARLAGDVFVTVQHHLRTERWMAAHLDGEVPPLRVKNMKMIMVDVRPRLFLPDVPDLATTGHLHIPDKSW
jgi:hypothetical protein